MSKIKVGQIYKTPNGISVVIDIKDCFIDMLSIDGIGIYTPSTLKDCELIAEYPTWQEAINSKEFNNG